MSFEVKHVNVTDVPKSKTNVLFGITIVLYKALFWVMGQNVHYKLKIHNMQRQHYGKSCKNKRFSVQSFIS